MSRRSPLAQEGEQGGYLGPLGAPGRTLLGEDDGAAGRRAFRIARSWSRALTRASASRVMAEDGSARMTAHDMDRP